MIWKDFEDLVKLLSAVREKHDILTKAFGGPVPLGSEIEFTAEQKQAIKDANMAWESFRQKARGVGGLVD